MNVVEKTDSCNSCACIYIEVPAGESWNGLSIQLPLDITGSLVRSQINFPAPLLLTNGNGGIIVNNATLGQITYNVTSANTVNIPAGKYPFDLWTESGAVPSINTRWLSGFVQILAEITPLV